jgi:hypothetical protein
MTAPPSSYAWLQCRGPNNYSLTSRILLNPNGGSVSIGTTLAHEELTVNGNASKPGGGSWAVFSDARLKKNIAPLQHSLEQLLALQGVTFEYIDPVSINEPSGTRIGMIAQAVEEIFPEWVSDTPGGYKSLSFSGFEALTVEALRDLREEKDQEIAQKDAEIASLTARVAELERLMHEVLTTRSQNGGSQ